MQQQRIKELLKLYDQEDDYPDLHDLAESLVDFDECIYLWRMNHVTVVERIIGFKKGTGGSDGRQRARLRVPRLAEAPSRDIRAHD